MQKILQTQISFDQFWITTKPTLYQRCIAAQRSTHSSPKPTHIPQASSNHTHNCSPKLPHLSHRLAASPLYPSHRLPSTITHATTTTALSAAAAVPPEPQNGTKNAFTRVVIPTALALLLCNMDRICLSVAILPLSAEMGWTEGTQGVLQSAFLWGYLANQWLGGTLADKYGGTYRL